MKITNESNKYGFAVGILVSSTDMVIAYGWGKIVINWSNSMEDIPYIAACILVSVVIICKVLKTL